MTDFKVGDRVKLKDDFNPDSHEFFAQSMHKYIGETFEVKEVVAGVVFNDEWAFQSDWLELVEREEAAEDKKESILQEAQRIVNGERQADYSDPVKNFEHIARIASAILNKR